MLCNVYGVSHNLGMQCVCVCVCVLGGDSERVYLVIACSFS